MALALTRSWTRRLPPTVRETAYRPSRLRMGRKPVSTTKMAMTRMNRWPQRCRQKMFGRPPVLLERPRLLQRPWLMVAKASCKRRHPSQRNERAGLRDDSARAERAELTFFHCCHFSPFLSFPFSILDMFLHSILIHSDYWLMFGHLAILTLGSFFLDVFIGMHVTFNYDRREPRSSHVDDLLMDSISSFFPITLPTHPDTILHISFSPASRTEYHPTVACMISTRNNLCPLHHHFFSVINDCLPFYPHYYHHSHHH